MEKSCGGLASFMTLLQTTMMMRCDFADSCRRAGKDEIVEGEWYIESDSLLRSWRIFSICLEHVACNLVIDVSFAMSQV